MGTKNDWLLSHLGFGRVFVGVNQKKLEHQALARLWQII
jgi:hypothetical protein